MKNLLDGFEVYEKQRTSPTAAPQVTVQARGIYSMSATAYAALGEPKFVELLYSRAKNAVAIRAVPTETLSAYQVRPANNGRVFNVAGKAFMTFHDIMLEDSRRYFPSHAADGVIVIDLDHDDYVVLKSTRRSAKVTDKADATWLVGKPTPQPT